MDCGEQMLFDQFITCKSELKFFDTPKINIEDRVAIVYA